ncbi:MAG: hypothetical protein Fues2KO_01020 [Fuerstiella sp.]
MRRLRSITLTIVVSVFLSSAADAQLQQLNAGGGGGQQNAGAGQAPGTAAAGGGTTDGPGGVTADGPGSSEAQDGGIAGGNISEVFIGGNNNEGFVGGGLETLFNINRQFQAITSQSTVPKGTTAESSGSPRRMPVAFKVAFDYPKQLATARAATTTAVSLTKVVVVRPELQSVVVSVDDAGTATLTGTAADGAAARLAANLVRLSPGVRRVDNQILVPLER